MGKTNSETLKKINSQPVTSRPVLRDDPTFHRPFPDAPKPEPDSDDAGKRKPDVNDLDQGVRG